MGIKALQEHKYPAKPILKWAGGKTQMLEELFATFPKSFNKYIEPFFGGGAVYFNLSPQKAVIADVNPELINLYQCVAKDPNKVLTHLERYKNDEAFFYKIRKQEFSSLVSFEAAARTVYLNKTCFNGLYRVNKSGHFNVPFGRYKNPKIADAEALFAASQLLANAEIVLGDYKTVLRKYARKGDLVFLDPPYLPISKYADFKRYTKDQFYEEDHKELAEEVIRLHSIGCHVVLTNSNHPLVHELYDRFEIDVIQTKRYINCDGEKRVGEDVIVVAKSNETPLHLISQALPGQVSAYPTTRWMGSKSKLLSHIHDATKNLPFNSAMDLFAGSGIVGYMFKSLGKKVVSSDYMALSACYATAMIENNDVALPISKAKKLLIEPKVKYDKFVQNTFEGLYFTNEENELIDILRHNIKKIANKYERAIAMSALMRTCTKKRPRGVFTYVGHRYDDGRKDLQISLADHFIKAVGEINKAVFNNGKKNTAVQADAMSTRQSADLIYMDPPYYSPLSDNEYVRRYHFIEGLACDWKGVTIQEDTKTKKFKNYPTPFSSQRGAYDAFDKLFNKFKDKILVVSYSSNSLPTLDEMVGLMSKYKSHVKVERVNYKYSFANAKDKHKSNDVQEYLFIGY